MKCADCGGELTQGTRDGVEMEICRSCNGMWLSGRELAQLEDKVFDFGDDEKGSLMLSSIPSDRKCPQCEARSLRVSDRQRVGPDVYGSRSFRLKWLCLMCGYTETENVGDNR